MSAALISHTDRLDQLTAAIRAHRKVLGPDGLGDLVESEMSSIDRVLARIRSSGIANGSVFCEWGSGLGGVCCAAALNGFESHGIEIESKLVAAARSIASDQGLDVEFTEGTYLLPGDEDLASLADAHTRPTFDPAGWSEAGLDPDDCDVVFAYPWPGEEAFIDRVFARRARTDSLLMTFHDFDRVFVQRKQRDVSELLPVGWM